MPSMRRQNRRNDAAFVSVTQNRRARPRARRTSRSRRSAAPPRRQSVVASGSGKDARETRFLPQWQGARGWFQDRDVRTGSDQRFGEPRALRDDVLAIVENEEQPLGLDGRAKSAKLSPA